MSVEIDAERSLAQDILAGRISWEQLDACARERMPAPEGQVAHTAESDEMHFSEWRGIGLKGF